MKGLKTYRHPTNPQEKIFHDKFIELYGEIRESSQIVFMVDGKGIPKNYTTKEQRDLMVTTIQWLGSPVGMEFLKKCGFKKIK
jgi:hypothetical protein